MTFIGGTIWLCSFFCRRRDLAPRLSKQVTGAIAPGFVVFTPEW